MNQESTEDQGFFDDGKDEFEPVDDEPKGDSSNQVSSLDEFDNDDDTAESSIANAKINMASGDLATAAGHHHHHKHYPHGWLKMGAHTGHKGAFGWHSKHPVGGKGRR